MAKITLQGVQKSYGSQRAIEHLDIEVSEGEFLVLLGPSGCGKTTTLNIMAGLETPDAGKTLFDGVDVTAVSPHERNVAMVFQSALLYPHLTARQNIETSLRRSTISTAEKAARLATAAQMLEIEPLLPKLPSAMSGGQRQRVAIAKAIVREPSLLLFDEPLSALDAGLRLTLRAELVNLQRRLKVTAVLVTHDQTEAMTMGDRIAIMNNGRIEQIGTPDEIYNAPRTLFVASFLGTPPMNLITGQIDGGIFVSGDLRLPATGKPGRATLGVRPQSLALSQAPDAVPAKVFALEHLGREVVIVAERDDGTKIRALVAPGYSARIGDIVRFAPDPAGCVLFDAAGQRSEASVSEKVH